MSPKKTMRFYRADNSGVNIRPHPDSSIKQEHRIYYHNFRTTHDFLTGQGLRKFAYRMQANLRTMVSKTEASSQWTEYKDLYVFVQQLLFPAAVEAMCGPVLLSLSPTFTSDFWEFDNHFPFFFKKYPRWLIPKGFRARDRLLQAVKSWLTYAHANFDQSMVSADGDWDPLFGSQFIRSRQDYCGKMADMSENAIASSELGMIWATNANSIPSAFWLLLEIIHDPELLERARHEVDQCHSSLSSPGNLDFDIDQLCKSPLLQSIYAETLRVYVAVFPIRTPEYKDFTLNNVLLKKDKLVAISSSVAHRDPTVWNTGRDNCHPLDTFSPERFLIYPDDEASGPLLKARKQELAPIQADTKEGPTFSLDGLSSSWIPYGGGQRMCPGRHFAKQEILLCFAVLVSSFDMKLRNSRKPSTDGRFYGLGALPPKEASPFLIRRRQA
ncbi:hypothetical protein MMC25_008348 [Agyrium rufum]|nr:hypothetical protein [Agyrium rufum]